MNLLTYVIVAIGFVIYYAGLYVWSERFDKKNPRNKDGTNMTDATDSANLTRHD